MLKGHNPIFAIWALAIIGLSIFLMPIILTQTPLSSDSKIDFRDTGQIGDTIGGITSPLISLLGAIITFLAFWIQVKANKVQTEQFDKQDISSKRERFETKFYDLLKIHRDNISEFNIEDKVRGRKCFVQMMSELRYIYCLLAGLNKATKNSKSLSSERVFNIAYLTFFFGIGRVSNTAYNDLFKEQYSDLIKEFHKLLKENREFLKNNEKQKATIPHVKGGICEMTVSYYPFNGHSSRLGHYFRNLFQLIKLILEQDDKIIDNKYEYIKILRAQLSTHEQLLLFYNIQSILGKPWDTVRDGNGVKWNIVKDFRFLKNIPLPYADFYKSPKELYGTVNSENKVLFEWDEIARRFDKLPHQ